MKQEVQFSPAYDKRNKDPNKNYGIGAVLIKFILSGEKGAYQFMIGTDWYLPHNQKELSAKGCGDLGSRSCITDCKPCGYDIGYHALTPQYEDQPQQSDSCEFLNGKPCYYDGSGLQADEFMPEFLAGGSDAVWRMLASRYIDRFGSGEKDIEALITAPDFKE